MKNKLNIITTDGNIKSGESLRSAKNSKRQELQAKFDRLWFENPRQFDPERNCIEKERLKRTWELLLKHTEIKGKRAVDLGCGGGVFAKLLATAGAAVDAIDVSSNALKVVRQYDNDKIQPIQDIVPYTTLEDDTYDLVISTELLGYLPFDERRLYFAELSRLVKPDGFVICSTSFDVYTEDALQAFGALVETEFHLPRFFH
jgi:2-polyprenyl-3-methyl-5-hydroxy-6-metoxy-1,4-benzoquinol methylase